MMDLSLSIASLERIVRALDARQHVNQKLDVVSISTCDVAARCCIVLGDAMRKAAGISNVRDQFQVVVCEWECRSSIFARPGNRPNPRVVVIM